MSSRVSLLIGPSVLLACLLLLRHLDGRTPEQVAPDTVYVQGRADTVLLRDTVRMIVEAPALKRIAPPAGRKRQGHVYEDSMLRLVVYADTVEAIELETLHERLSVLRVDTVTIRAPVAPERRSWLIGAGIYTGMGPSLSFASGKGRLQYAIHYAPITQGMGFSLNYKIR